MDDDDEEAAAAPAAADAAAPSRLPLALESPSTMDEASLRNSRSSLDMSSAAAVTGAVAAGFADGAFCPLLSTTVPHAVMLGAAVAGGEGDGGLEEDAPISLSM